MKSFRVKQAKKNYQGNTYWLTLGHAMEKGESFSVKLETLPLPNENGEIWLQLFEKEKENEIQETNEETFQQT